MKIIVPMAGMGKRMRPHTLTTPKPLIPIAGKSIVQRLVEDIANLANEEIDEVAFIIGDFGKEVENNLTGIAEKIGAKGSIYYQDEPLGTAHAILCAKPSLSGRLVVAFADTLFHANMKLDMEQDGILWTKQVDDPRAFGVVVTNEEGIITRFEEKPTEFVSDQAIIGIYYFKDGEGLAAELQYLIDEDIKDKGEYQLTNALENMKQKGKKFRSFTVDQWMDCGNKDATVQTNHDMLGILQQRNEELISPNAIIEDSVIIEPCFIAAGAKISNSIIGPHVSIGENSSIDRSVIDNSLILQNTAVSNTVCSNSMIGNNVEYEKQVADLNIGDFCVIKD